MGGSIKAMPTGALAGPAPAGRLPDMADSPDGLTDNDTLTIEQLAAMSPVPSGISDSEVYVHDENLAEQMSDDDLNRIGQQLSELITADLQSRMQWAERFKRGLEIVGLKDFVWGKGQAPFDGASNAIHPMLAEAIVQSQARFMEEIFPAEGPVKTVVMGVETPDKRDSADRVADHMNYQLTIEDPTYFMETQKLSMYLPIFGSAYRKGYRDYTNQMNVLRFITGEDLILPYSARSLMTSPRITHRFTIGKDELELAVIAGAYVDADLAVDSTPDPTPEQEQIDTVDSKEPETGDTDVSWTLYETDMYLEAVGPDAAALGGSNGGPLPYTVTIERESEKVLSIRRNWKQDDDLKRRRVRYAEYWYLPGLGVYGFGLIHMIGTLAESGTDALRALLDAATWATMQGGFKSKDAAVKAGEMHMTPGVWKDVDMTSDELSKAFHTLPVKEPSSTLMTLLTFLTEQAQRFAGTTELMIGEGQAKGAPVGTTVAMIEQGQKVYSGVHKRAHFAAGIEFRMLFDLNAEYIPDDGYPYQVPGDDLAVYKLDYNEKLVGVKPVSDPNIFSQTQRIALAQAVYQLYQENKGDFKRTPVLRNLLKAFKYPDIDDVLVDWANPPDLDPVTENVAMATGSPVKALDGQDHDMHLANHMAFLQHPQFGGLPEAAQILQPPMMAHIAEHLALKYAAMMRNGGVPLGKIAVATTPGSPIDTPQNGASSNQIAEMAAKLIPAFMQSSGLATPPGNDPAAQAQDDAHKVATAKEFNLITVGLQNLVKLGMNIQQIEAMVQTALAAPNLAAPPAAPAGPAGPAPTPIPAPAPARPVAPAPAPAPKVPVPTP